MENLQFGQFGPFYGIVGLVYLVLVVWALWDIFSSGRSGCSIFLWVMLILFAPVLGAIIYLLFGRQRVL